MTGHRYELRKQERRDFSYLELKLQTGQALREFFCDEAPGLQEI